jgi:hypothetical protein
MLVCGLASLGLGAATYGLPLPHPGPYTLATGLWVLMAMPFWLVRGALRRARYRRSHPVPALLGGAAIWFACFLAFATTWADGKHAAEAAMAVQTCAPNCVPAEGSGLDQSRLTPSQSTMAVATQIEE